MHQENSDNPSAPEPSKAQQAGLMLRKLREDKGLSLHDLSQITRIQQNYVEALEAGRLGDLPGLFFINSFIRYIGKELRAENELIKEICSLTSTPANPNQEPSTIDLNLTTTNGVPGKKSKRSAASPAKWPPREALLKAALPKLRQKGQSLQLIALSTVNWASMKKASKYMRFFAVACLLIAGMIGLWKFGKKLIHHNEAMTTTTTTTVKGTVTATPISTNSEPKPDVATTTPDSTAALEGAPLETVAPDLAVAAQPVDRRAKLDFIVKAPVDIRKSCDGLSSERLSLNPGQHTYLFEDQCELMIYDAGSVEVFFNDKPVGSLGQKNRIRRLAFVNDRNERKPQ